SPTYTLVEHYPISSLYFFHFDFYRFTNPNEWDSAGMSHYSRDDAFGLVEWPERVGDRLPKPDLALSLSYADEDEGRDVVAVAHTAASERLLTGLAGAETLAS